MDSSEYCQQLNAGNKTIADSKYKSSAFSDPEFRINDQLVDEKNICKIDQELFKAQVQELYKVIVGKTPRDRTCREMLELMLEVRFKRLFMSNDNFQWVQLNQNYFRPVYSNELKQTARNGLETFSCPKLFPVGGNSPVSPRPESLSIGSSRTGIQM